MCGCCGLRVTQSASDFRDPELFPIPAAELVTTEVRLAVRHGRLRSIVHTVALARPNRLVLPHSFRRQYLPRQ